MSYVAGRGSMPAKIAPKRGVTAPELSRADLAPLPQHGSIVGQAGGLASGNEILSPNTRNSRPNDFITVNEHTPHEKIVDLTEVETLAGDDTNFSPITHYSNISGYLSEISPGSVEHEVKSADEKFHQECETHPGSERKAKTMKRLAASDDLEQVEYLGIDANDMSSPPIFSLGAHDDHSTQTNSHSNSSDGFLDSGADADEEIPPSKQDTSPSKRSIYTPEEEAEFFEKLHLERSGRFDPISSGEEADEDDSPSKGSIYAPDKNDSQDTSPSKRSIHSPEESAEFFEKLHLERSGHFHQMYEARMEKEKEKEESLRRDEEFFEKLSKERSGECIAADAEEREQKEREERFDELMRHEQDKLFEERVALDAEERERQEQEVKYHELPSLERVQQVLEELDRREQQKKFDELSQQEQNQQILLQNEFYDWMSSRSMKAIEEDDKWYVEKLVLKERNRILMKEMEEGVNAIEEQGGRASKTRAYLENARQEAEMDEQAEEEEEKTEKEQKIQKNWKLFQAEKLEREQIFREETLRVQMERVAEERLEKMKREESDRQARERFEAKLQLASETEEEKAAPRTPDKKDQVIFRNKNITTQAPPPLHVQTIDPSKDIFTPDEDLLSGAQLEQYSPDFPLLSILSSRIFS